MEPHVNLTFSMRSTSGGYAILLGAGASVVSVTRVSFSQRSGVGGAANTRRSPRTASAGSAEDEHP